MSLKILAVLGMSIGLSACSGKVCEDPLVLNKILESVGAVKLDNVHGYVPVEGIAGKVVEIVEVKQDGDRTVCNGRVTVTGGVIDMIDVVQTVRKRVGPDNIDAATQEKWSEFVADFGRLNRLANMTESVDLEVTKRMVDERRTISSSITYAVNTSGEKPSLYGWEHNSLDDFIVRRFTEQYTPLMKSLLREYFNQ